MTYNVFGGTLNIAQSIIAITTLKLTIPTISCIHEVANRQTDQTLVKHNVLHTHNNNNNDNIYIDSIQDLLCISSSSPPQP